MEVLTDGETLRQLRLMSGQADPVMNWQTFCDYDKSLKHLSKSFRGRLSDVQGKLSRAQQLGCGVFVSVNSFSGARRKENLESIRALFLDFDAAALPDEWPITPDLILNTSPGKHQVLWTLRCGVEVRPWLALQRALQERYGADPHCRGNVCQVMRVGGFRHMKDRAHPFLVRIVHGGGWPYAFELDLLACAFEVDLKAAIAALREVSLAKAHAVGPPPCGYDSPADVQFMTEFLRNADNWDLTPNGGGIYRTACVCRDYAISPATATELMEEHCPIGFDDPSHIAAKVAHAYRYATGEPGGRSFAKALRDFKQAADESALDFSPYTRENPFDE